MAGSKFDSKSFNPQAFGRYVERIPQLKKNELIKSGALKGNSEIKNAFSSQTGTSYAVLPMYGLLDGDVLNYDGQTDITATNTTLKWTLQRTLQAVLSSWTMLLIRLRSILMK